MASTTSRHSGGLPLSTWLLFFLVSYLYLHMLFLSPVSKIAKQQQLQAVLDARIHSPSMSSSRTRESDFQRRVTRLENMLFSYLSFGSDPFLYGRKDPKAVCRRMSKLEDHCAKYKKDCHLGMPVCLDDFPKNNCVVYDFGIREQPEFGVVLSRDPFGCEIHAFDPSPITKKWYQTSEEGKELQKNPKYTLYDYGGGGADEEVVLREYNWEQVSIYRYPERVLNINDCNENGQCRYTFHKVQKEHMLPVRSVTSVMMELGHERIDVLKIDVEGSEYRMLEELILSGACLKVDQITLEWHHYDVDLRYGEGAVPMINVLIKLLAEECGLYQYWIHNPTGWPSNEKIYGEMGIILRYNIAAFRRVKK